MLVFVIREFNSSTIIGIVIIILLCFVVHFFTVSSFEYRFNSVIESGCGFISVDNWFVGCKD